MKLSKTTILIGLGIIIVVSIIAALIFKFAPRPSTNNKATSTSVPSASSLSFKMVPSATALNVGEKVKVSVYLNGENAQKTSVVELKFIYDKAKLQLLSAIPGNFFNPFLKVKWDDKLSWFVLSKNPESANPPDINSPILTLEFSAVSKTGSTILSTDPASGIYLSLMGGVSPGSLPVSFTIK